MEKKQTNKKKPFTFSGQEPKRIRVLTEQNRRSEDVKITIQVTTGACVRMLKKKYKGRNSLAHPILLNGASLSI